MTRLALCSFLCAVTIVLALATAALQSHNRERQIALDLKKQECEMLEAANSDRSERILAIDWRTLPPKADPLLAGGAAAAATGRRSSP